MVNYTGISPTPISVPWTRPPNENSLAVAADRSLLIEGYEPDIDVMADLILQNIGAVELSLMTRYDSLDGARMAYSPLTTKSRLPQYSVNNLMGQPNSALSASGQDLLNTSHYVQGELPRGYALEGEPPAVSMDIQVAVTADVVPFSVTGEVYEVV